MTTQDNNPGSKAPKANPQTSATADGPVEHTMNAQLNAAVSGPTGPVAAGPTDEQPERHVYADLNMDAFIAEMKQHFFRELEKRITPDVIAAWLKERYPAQPVPPATAPVEIAQPGAPIVEIRPAAQARELRHENGSTDRATLLGENVLEWVGKQKSVSPRGLRKQFAISEYTAHGIMAELEQKGFIDYKGKVFGSTETEANGEPGRLQRAVGYFLCLPRWKQACIVGGVAAAGVGGYYLSGCLMRILHEARKAAAIAAAVATEAAPEVASNVIDMPTGKVLEGAAAAVAAGM